MTMVIMVMVVKSWNVKCSSFQFSDGYGDYGDGCESWNVKFSSLQFSDGYGDYGDGCEIMECKM